jgi:hypothetical protein
MPPQLLPQRAQQRPTNKSSLAMIDNISYAMMFAFCRTFPRSRQDYDYGSEEVLRKGERNGRFLSYLPLVQVLQLVERSRTLFHSMISPDTRQNVTRLRARQDDFQQQIMLAISWDISALDFVDVQIGRSLRDLVMKIESRQHPGQQLFHVVDETWNQNGFRFALFPSKRKLVQ